GTTGRTGYAYSGNKYDWTGYGHRDIPPALADFFARGERLSAGNVDSAAIASQLVGRNNGIVQKIEEIPPNCSASITGGNTWLIGDSELGVIATAGFNNGWRTRDNIEQTPATFDLSVIDKDYRSVATENRAVTNALVGLGYGFGDGHTLRSEERRCRGRAWSSVG